MVESCEKATGSTRPPCPSSVSEQELHSSPMSDFILIHFSSSCLNDPRLQHGLNISADAYAWRGSSTMCKIKSRRFVIQSVQYPRVVSDACNPAFCRRLEDLAVSFSVRPLSNPYTSSFSSFFPCSCQSRIIKPQMRMTVSDERGKMLSGSVRLVSSMSELVST
jgi:hypothetical protein